jgi:uncharacterized membrane protein
VSEPEHQHHLTEQLSQLNGRLSQLVVSAEHAERVVAQNTGRLVPAWRRVTVTEQRLPVTLAVIAMITLQSRIPEHLSLFRWWILPVIEAVLLAVLIAANPRRVDQNSRRLRLLSLLLIAVASLANGWAAGSLIVGLVHGSGGKDATTLLLTGANIWFTNIVIFGLWYWDLDRGGPGARACAVRERPDFVFPQMTAPDLAGPDWEPQFLDYLYLAFTNATAFSPTDTMPFSRWSKMAMMLQSSISLVTGALIVARAVNILS